MKNLPDLFFCQWRSDGARRIAIEPKHEPAFFCMIDMAMKNEGINIFGGEGFTVPIDIARSLILFSWRSGFAMKSLFRKNDSPWITLIKVVRNIDPGGKLFEILESNFRGVEIR